jgi:hypothetical protein
VTVDDLKTWAKGHVWLLVAVALAFVVGRLSVPKATPVAIESSQKEKATELSTSETNSKKREGSKDIDIVIGQGDATCQKASNPPSTYPAPKASKDQEPFEITLLPPGTKIHIHEGPSTETNNTKTQDFVEKEKEAKVSVTPAPVLPNMSLSLGFENLFEARSVKVGVGYKVIDKLPLVNLPIWVRADWTPSRGLSGASVMVETQFYFRGL